MSSDSKQDLIGRLIAAYRANTSQEGAFDALAAAKLGISPSDLRCLDLVEASGGMTAGELARASGLTSGAVTAVIDRLEQAGFVRRARDAADRRKVNVEVTPLHYKESAKIWKPLMDDWLETLAARFTAQELRTITEFLESATELGERHAERIAPD
jgi:DNA-binding MarR family transcriptional regulator